MTDRRATIQSVARTAGRFPRTESANISTQWDDYEHVTDSGIATELFQMHFGREPGPADMESLQEEFLSQLENAVRGTTIPTDFGCRSALTTITVP